MTDETTVRLGPTPGRVPAYYRPEPTGFRGEPDGALAIVTGHLAYLTRQITKQGRAYVTGFVRDQVGEVALFVAPALYERFGGVLAEGDTVCVSGRVDRRGDVPVLSVEHVTPSSDTVELPGPAVSLRRVVESGVHALIAKHPDQTPAVRGLMWKTADLVCTLVGVPQDRCDRDPWCRIAAPCPEHAAGDAAEQAASGWEVHHVGFGVVPYRDERAAVAAAGTAGTVLHHGRVVPWCTGDGNSAVPAECGLPRIHIRHLIHTPAGEGGGDATRPA